METSVKRLDIRFVPLEPRGPLGEVNKLTVGHRQEVIEELHSRLGHLSNEINKRGGYIKVYTLGNSVVGEPQYINFTNDLRQDLHREFSVAGFDEEDYLDHGNYTDF